MVSRLSDSGGARWLVVPWSLMIGGVLYWYVAKGTFVDFRCYYAAGASWLSGGSMYDPLVYNKFLYQIALVDFKNGFAYAPHFFPFAIATNFTTYESSREVFKVGFLFGAMVLAWTAPCISVQAPLSVASSLALVAMVALNPFTRHALMTAQFTIWVLIFLVIGWLLIHRWNREILGGTLIAIAGVKPQFAILVVLWLVLERRWKAVAAIVLVPVFMAAYPLCHHGPRGLIESWMATISGFTRSDTGLSVDLPGHPLTLGLVTMLHTIGIRFSVYVSLLVSVAATALLYASRRRIRPEFVFPVLLALAVVFVHGHTYDMIFLVPAVVVLWPSPASSWTWRVLGGGVSLVYFLGPRLVGLVGYAYLEDHWETPFSILVLVLLLARGMSNRVNEQGRADDTAQRSVPLPSWAK